MEFALNRPAGSLARLRPASELDSVMEFALNRPVDVLRRCIPAVRLHGWLSAIRNVHKIQVLHCYVRVKEGTLHNAGNQA